MTGVAATLAAHQVWLVPATMAGPSHLRCLCGWRTPASTFWQNVGAAHQAEVLASAGFGDLTALLNDLRELMAKPPEFSLSVPTQHTAPPPTEWPIHPKDAHALLARYSPDQQPPKEPQT